VKLAICHRQVKCGRTTSYRPRLRKGNWPRPRPRAGCLLIDVRLAVNACAETMTAGEAGPSAANVLFALAPLPSLWGLFGTARSSPGRTGFTRRSEPWTARTVLEHRREGKESTSCPVHVAVTGTGIRYVSFLHKTAPIIRTKWFAGATIATFWWVRAIS
jgi:hypothetical protein